MGSSGSGEGRYLKPATAAPEETIVSAGGLIGEASHWLGPADTGSLGNNLAILADPKFTVWFCP